MSIVTNIRNLLLDSEGVFAALPDPSQPFVYLFTSNTYPYDVVEVHDEDVVQEEEESVVAPEQAQAESPTPIYARFTGGITHYYYSDLSIAAVAEIFSPKYMSPHADCSFATLPPDLDLHLAPAGDLAVTDVFLRHATGLSRDGSHAAHY